MKFEKVSFEEFVRAVSWCGLPVEGECVRRLYDQIKIPERATAKSSGHDFHMPFDLECRPGVQYMIPTGIKFDSRPDCSLDIYPRSSAGIKYGLTLSNTTPIIDADYYGNDDNEGHIFIAFEVKKPVDLKAGDRIVQGKIVRYEICDDDSATGTRTGGIGSTGV